MTMQAVAVESGVDAVSCQPHRRTEALSLSVTEENIRKRLVVGAQLFLVDQETPAALSGKYDVCAVTSDFACRLIPRGGFGADDYARPPFLHEICDICKGEMVKGEKQGRDGGVKHTTPCESDCSLHLPVPSYGTNYQ